MNFCPYSSRRLAPIGRYLIGCRIIIVEVECSSGDYAEGIYAKAAAGNLPDVVFSADLFTVPFVTNNVLLDLEQFDEVDDSFTFDDVYENILALGQVPGIAGTYMIPASWDSVQMYYNKTMFADSGAPMPQDDWTWDDLISACKIVREANPGVYCIANGGADGWDWWAYFIPWIVGYGGAPVSEDFTLSTFSSPESLEGIQAYVDQSHIDLYPHDCTARGRGICVGLDPSSGEGARQCGPAIRWPTTGHLARRTRHGIGDAGLVGLMGDRPLYGDLSGRIARHPGRAL